MNVRGASLGGAAALVQLTATWATLARIPTIHFPVGSLSSDQIDNFVRQLHGLAASLVCDSALDQSGQEYYDKLQANGLLKLHQLDGSFPLTTLHRFHDMVLLCADHLGRSTPRLLYGKNDDGTVSVRNESEFRKLARWIIRSIVPDRRLDIAKQFDADAIGSMLHEVIENTEEHAITDVDGNILKKSIRGFYARHHMLEEHQIDQLTTGYPALQQFCYSIPEPKTGTRQLIEISVFDSGPGLAQRIKKAPLSTLSLPAEFAAVQSCFREGVTTKARSGRGIGLHYVFELLREKRGFLRLRTGRLSLFADLSTDIASSDLDVIPLNDTRGGDLRQRRTAQGTLITLLIPIAR